MWKALVFKELRELAPIAALALCAYAVIVARLIGVDILFFWPTTRSYGGDVPFVSDGFTAQWILISVCFAVALAIKQTLGESGRGTWLWLLHRPISRTQIVVAKLLMGTAVYLVCGALPILWYSCWAAMPRTHPSPFFWSMTVETWISLALTGTLYLAAFWCGLWPARSLGPRWMPLVAMGVGVLLGYELLSPITAVGAGIWALLLSALAVLNILPITHSRDFS